MAPSPLGLRVKFSVFEVDRSASQLIKRGRPVKLAPQPFKVLLLLLDRHGQVVTRGDIQRHLWGESTFVDFERGINFSINQIRAALGDDPEKPRYIETLPKLGYRFVGDVTPGAGTEPVVPAAGAVALESDLSDPSGHQIDAPDLQRPTGPDEFQLPPAVARSVPELQPTRGSGTRVLWRADSFYEPNGKAGSIDKDDTAGQNGANARVSVTKVYLGRRAEAQAG